MDDDPSPPPSHLPPPNSMAVPASVDGSPDQAPAQPLEAAAHYQVGGEIARGGMGAVLRAVDRDICREVAVKFLINHADDRQRARFVEEARITGQLEHPNIVPIHQLGVHGDGRCFFSMKLVKGRSLAEILRSPQADDTLGRLLTILVSICNAVSYAHSRKVIHRDVKPANIMVGDFGEVYLMDWGLAKVMKEPGAEPVADEFAFSAIPVPPAPMAATTTTTAELTQDGAILGTPAYMSPEQARGEEVDHRADVYSLGAILYEMMTLTPPVGRGGELLALLMRVAEGQIDPPEKRAPDRVKTGWISPELSAIAMKALATKRDDRYQTVESFRHDLERFLEGRSVSAKRDSTWEMIKKLIKRNRAISAITGVATLALTVALGWSWWVNHQARQQTIRSVPAFLEAAQMGVERRNYKNARDQVELALLYDPENLEARLVKSRILIVEGEFPQAVAELDRYLLKKPGDPKAAQLRERCAVAKPQEVANIIELAKVFEKQELQAFSTGLLMRHAESIEARKQMLRPYQNKIDAAWPGLGKYLLMDKNGLLTLSLANQKQIVSLAPLEGIPLTELSIASCRQVHDLTPLRAMPLTKLNVYYSSVSDFSPLQGMRLTTLNAGYLDRLDDLSPLQGMPLVELSLQSSAQVHDLSALQGMPLTMLDLANCKQVRDISALERMPLSNLNLQYCGVSNLAPLRGAPLTRLELYGTPVQNLTPLQGMNLNYLRLTYTRVRDLSPLQGMKLSTLDLSNTPVVDLTGISGLPLTRLDLTRTGVFNLDPLRDSPLISLTLTGCGALKDLGPLQGMSLTSLDLEQCGQVQDLAPLRGMPLTSLNLRGTKVDDLTPLEGMHLLQISFHPKSIVRGIDVLREIKSLTSLADSSFRGTPQEFWRKYDAGEFKK